MARPPSMRLFIPLQSMSQGLRNRFIDRDLPDIGKRMSTVVAKSAHQLAGVAMATSILTGLPAAQAAGVDQAVGALAYVPQTEVLYKSDGQALYRSDDGGKQWTKVPLTSRSNDGRVMAVAVSAGGQGALYVAGSGLGVLKSVDDRPVPA